MAEVVIYVEFANGTFCYKRSISGGQSVIGKDKVSRPQYNMGSNRGLVVCSHKLK